MTTIRPRVEQIVDATLYLGDYREIMPNLGRLEAVIEDPPVRNFLEELTEPSSARKALTDPDETEPRGNLISKNNKVEA